jgi:rod shape-determining protein MreD
MVDPVAQGQWLARGLFVAVVMALLFLRLLPLPGEPGGLPGPDLLMCLCCAWVLRRPDHLPALLIALAVLLEDVLLMRPPGLWAALMLVGTEFLRSRAAFSRELTFVSEWVMVAVVMLAMTLGYRLALAVTVTPQAGLGLTLIQFLVSVAAYPLVVGALRLAFGLRKPATGEVDALGRPL